jgi:hypothetical protein
MAQQIGREEGIATDEELQTALYQVQEVLGDTREHGSIQAERFHGIDPDRWTEVITVWVDSLDDYTKEQAVEAVLTSDAPVTLRTLEGDSEKFTLYPTNQEN